MKRNSSFTIDSLSNRHWWKPLWLQLKLLWKLLHNFEWKCWPCEKNVEYLKRSSFIPACVYFRWIKMSKLEQCELRSSSIRFSSIRFYSHLMGLTTYKTRWLLQILLDNNLLVPLHFAVQFATCASDCVNLFWSFSAFVLYPDVNFWTI